MSLELKPTYTYNEYLLNPPEREQPYELINGKIIEMPPESYINVQIALKLLQILATEFGIERISNKAEIITGGSKVTSRIPDLVVFDVRGIAEIEQKNTSTIDLDMLPPLLAVEVVSPGKEASNRDYRFKRSEYAARGIRYYWIIDPQQKVASFLELELGVYETEIVAISGTVTVECSEELTSDNILHRLEINLDDFWLPDAG